MCSIEVFFIWSCICCGSQTLDQVGFFLNDSVFVSDHELIAGRMASSKHKFNVNAAEFDPTSVTAAVAGLGVDHVPSTSPAEQALPMPTETRVILRKLPKNVDSMTLIKHFEMRIGHVVGCDFSGTETSLKYAVVSFQFPQSAAMLVTASQAGVPVIPKVPVIKAEYAVYDNFKTPSSNTVVLKGLPRGATRSDCLRAVCAVTPPPAAMELHLRDNGELLLRYADLGSAGKAAKALHKLASPEAASEKGGAGLLTCSFKRGDPIYLSEKNLIEYTIEGVPTLLIPGASRTAKKEGAREGAEGPRRGFGFRKAVDRSESFDSVVSSSSHTSWRWGGEGEAPAAAASSMPRRQSRTSSFSSQGSKGSRTDTQGMDWGHVRGSGVSQDAAPSSSGPPPAEAMAAALLAGASGQD